MTEKNRIREEATCAGKEIASCMSIFSDSLLQGCKYFLSLITKTTKDKEIIFINAACIFFAAGVIEAKINEWISLRSFIFDRTTDSDIGDNVIPPEFWKTLEQPQKNLKLEDKWNLIASVCSGTLWDNGKEPFQSYNTILSVRNHLIHYKGQFLGKNKTPVKKIEDLMKKIGVSSSATFVEDDASTWIDDLLGEPKLGHWVYEKTCDFESGLLKLLFGNK